jgi:hypothetical protein
MQYPSAIESRVPGEGTQVSMQRVREVTGGGRNAVTEQKLGLLTFGGAFRISVHGRGSHLETLESKDLITTLQPDHGFLECVRELEGTDESESVVRVGCVHVPVGEQQGAEDVRLVCVLSNETSDANAWWSAVEGVRDGPLRGGEELVGSAPGFANEDHGLAESPPEDIHAVCVEGWGAARVGLGESCSVAHLAGPLIDIEPWLKGGFGLHTHGLRAEPEQGSVATEGHPQQSHGGESKAGCGKDPIHFESQRLGAERDSGG